MSAYSDLLLATNPVAYWRLGEAAGLTAVDASGNGHNGTYVNGPVLGQPGLIADTDTAVLFDGSNDRVAVPQDPALQIAGALTVQAWIRQDAAAVKRIVYQGDAGGDPVRLFDFYVQANGALGLTWSNGAGGFPAVDSPPSLIAPGNTHHVAAVRDASFFVRLYVDGVEVAAVQRAGPAPGTPTNLQIGSFAAVLQFFNGVIDEVAIHNYALTAEQVGDLYNVGVYGPRRPGTPRPARRYHRLRRGVTR